MRKIVALKSPYLYFLRKFEEAGGDVNKAIRLLKESFCANRLKDEGSPQGGGPSPKTLGRLRKYLVKELGGIRPCRFLSRDQQNPLTPWLLVFMRQLHQNVLRYLPKRIQYEEAITHLATCVEDRTMWHQFHRRQPDLLSIWYAALREDMPDPSSLEWIRGRSGSEEEE